MRRAPARPGSLPHSRKKIPMRHRFVLLIVLLGAALCAPLTTRADGGAPANSYTAFGFDTFGAGTQATALNDAGHVAGLFPVGDQTHAFLWKDGVLSDLGTLGGSMAAPLAINNLDQVVGWSYTAGGFQ